MSLQIPSDIISEHDELMIRFHADDSMGFKGFVLSYLAVDPFPGSDFDNSENVEEEESAEVEPTYFPGYYVGGSLRVNQRKDEDYEEPEEIYKKKPDQTEDIDEDLVTDNEDNHIFNSNRINKENTKIVESNKKKEIIDEDEDDD